MKETMKVVFIIRSCLDSCDDEEASKGLPGVVLLLVM